MSIKTIYSCSNCGAQYHKWQGRCQECGSWSTIKEEISDTKKEISVSPDIPINLNKLPSEQKNRIKTNISEFDNVLGGGIVLGSLILLGGDPGVGKSTIALQLAKDLKNILYISGEESAQQVKIRADRLAIDLDNLHFLNQTNTEKIIATISDIKPSLVIIDSIQTIYSADSSIGTANQIIASTTKLIEIAKKSNIPIIIIGHVTKEGIVAGPKTLEHLVDTVLYLENDNKNHYKILRSVKNRFGSTGEIGIFEMTKLGLKEITNPTEIFFQDSSSQNSGTVTTIILEGQRPFLIEIQALVSKTSFGYPQRKTSGFDLNRLQMIIAIISKITKLNLSNQDIYLNITGGIKVKETATDLAVAIAIVSAFLDIHVDKQIIIFGELGLTGEIRSVSQSEKRIREAEKLKFNKIISPLEDASKINNKVARVKNIGEVIKIIQKEKVAPNGTT